MYQAVQKCTHCGANLTLDDLRKPNCTYCGTVYPHRAQAAQHAEVAGQVFNQMVAQQAQIQASWQNAYGMGPPPGGPGMGPPMGPPPGAAMNPFGPGSPYANPHHIAAAHMAHATGIARSIRLVVTLAVVGSFVLTAVIIGVVMWRL